MPTRPPTHTHPQPAHTHAGTTATSGGGSAGYDNSGGNATINNHTHTYTTGSIAGPTSGTTVATWSSAENEPSNYVVIFIESDGTPDGFPDDCIVYFDRASAPPNWVQHVGSEGRFFKGAAGGGDGGGTGGGAHTHTTVAHTHSIGNHQHGNVAVVTLTGTNPSGGGPSTAVVRSHGHNTVASSDGSGTSGSGTTPASAGTDHEPTNHILLAVQNTSGSVSMFIGAICKFTGVLSTTPARWKLCDGSQGTPDLRDKFIKNAASGGADVGNTGGGGNHLHTGGAGHTHNAGHVHSISTNTSSATHGTGTGTPANHDHSHAAGNSDSAGTLSATAMTLDNTLDAEPLHRTVAYVQYEGPPAVLLGAAF